MSYYYSALGPERFQEFCQALLVACFPNVQCMPVGQPDGGRDAFAMLRHNLITSSSSNERNEERIVFQVKFSRAPSEDREEREFLQEIVQSERKKVARLKRGGLTRYYLLTNVGGTAHPGSGSIDRMNTYLTKELGVDAFCWWRDDLDRRLDNLPALKWSYPEILKATDLLPALMSGALGEAEQRRQGALQAYLAAQYEDDEELKFKQVELQNKMTELFVDLPMAPVQSTTDPSSWHSLQLQRRTIRRRRPFATEHYFVETGDYLDLAANFFLESCTRPNPTRIVLEGAPGQGKSTVTQYVCQIMRMQLLGKMHDLTRVPEGHRKAMVRLPFRVDLRDFAAWNSGNDPFQRKPALLSQDEPRSLEGFLAAQVRFHSGGHSFTVSDLSAVIRASHVLLTLDGFDEVADVAIRQKLVQEITKATTRLENAGGYSVLVIITSRPAAFAKSVGFPRESWSYFELLPFERQQVDEYADKWMRAKSFKEQEKANFRKILDSKLKEPHTQFLSRNPMQLTILLALIYTRGPSLPEKRTSMYDTYMDLFFSRESEKSNIVKEHRDLLIDIHRYLAWCLQTAAETGASGSIESEELKTVLFNYLESQGELTAIVDDLFDGVIERVGALVSRVQETYEFEVQPLREYFAARYLYETAPYSPAGNEKAGTKIERFDALARNPYWLNVARFYAGCFSKGEISALVDALKEIATSDPYALTSHPRALALMLLGDWVFTQYQPAVRRVIELIAQRPNIRQLLASAERDGAAVWTMLPDRCGRGDFVDALFKRLAEGTFLDECPAVGQALVQNLTLNERLNRWVELRPEVDLLLWITIGEALRIFADAPADRLLHELSFCRVTAVPALIRAGRFDVLEAEGTLKAEATRHLLNDAPRDFFCPSGTHKSVELVYLAWITSELPYYIALSDDSERPLRSILLRRLGLGLPHRGGSISWLCSEQDDFDSLTESCPDLKYYSNFLEYPSVVLAKSLSPWTDLVESLRRRWGDAPAFDRIAIFGSGVRSKAETGRAPNGMFDATTPLVERFRFARLKSGAPRWWLQQLETALPGQIRTTLLLLWIWGTPKTLVRLAPEISKRLEPLNDDIWRDLAAEFAASYNVLQTRDEFPELNPTDLKVAASFGPRMAVMLGKKIAATSRFALTKTVFSKYDGDDEVVLQFMAETLMIGIRKRSEWDFCLPLLRRTYERGSVFIGSRQRRETTMGPRHAKQISERPESYPLSVVAEADAALRSRAGASSTPLLEVSVAEKWFDSIG